MNFNGEYTDPPRPAGVSAFDFDVPCERRDTNSLKWDGARQLLTRQQAEVKPLPMWVADMDFRAAPPILDALGEAIASGVFGYPLGPTASYLSAVAAWQEQRFGWRVDTDWIVPVAGVITSLKTAIQAFTAPGESVLIQTPVYAHFSDDVALNGRVVTAAPLRFDGTRYHFDDASFERALRADTKLFILSNPHNPTGNVWSQAELRTMGEICRRRGVLVVSDEIHQDFILAPGRRHIPFASLGSGFADNSITCISASKTFNLAGLQCANAVISNPRLRQVFKQQVDRNQAARVNMLGMVATEAAYRHCGSWVDALVNYIRINQRHFADFINNCGIGLRVLPMDSLYLAWIDCRGTSMDQAELHDHLLTRCGVWLDNGLKFGLEGRGFMRANLGCPRATVTDAVGRLRAGMPARPATTTSATD